MYKNTRIYNIVKQINRALTQVLLSWHSISQEFLISFVISNFQEPIFQSRDSQCPRLLFCIWHRKVYRDYIDVPITDSVYIISQALSQMKSFMVVNSVPDKMRQKLFRNLRVCVCFSFIFLILIKLLKYIFGKNGWILSLLFAWFLLCWKLYWTLEKKVK